MFLLALLFFPPIFAIPFLVSFHKKVGLQYNFRFITQLWFFISVIGLYWFPWGDSQTHFSVYYSDIVDTYYEKSLMNTHWFYDWIIQLVADFFGNYVFGYWVWIFFPFFIYVFAIYYKNERIDKKNLLVVLYLLLSLGIRELLDLNRNSSAGLLFVASILLFKDLRKLSVVLLLTSFLLHSTTRYLFIVLPLGFILSRFSVRKLNWLAFIVPFFSYTIMLILVSIFLDERNFEMYFTSDALESEGVGSGLMKIITYINILIFL